jgi:hypothetical protein
MMPDTRTPGELAYAAWHAIVIPALVPGYGEDWSQVSVLEQRAWEAAAEAVLDAWQAQPRLETPRRKEDATP